MTDDTVPPDAVPPDAVPPDAASPDAVPDRPAAAAAQAGPSLAALTAAGFNVDALSDEQHEVLRALTPEELALLVDIRGRLDAAAPEVQAHADVAGGALF